MVNKYINNSFFTWYVMGKQNNNVKFGVPGFFDCSGVTGCSGVFRCSGVPVFLVLVHAASTCDFSAERARFSAEQAHVNFPYNTAADWLECII